MFRVWVRVLGLASLLAAGGCAKDGTLNVSWDFLGTEPASSGCGQHGVDSILLTGIDTSGDSLYQVALCVPGQTTASVKPGSWTVALQMRNFQEKPEELPDAGPPDAGTGPDGGAPPPPPPPPTGMAQVSTDVPGSVLIHLTPLPACQDGVDNDGDGRVDLDDPDCHNDRDGTSE
jgi:hypothetical protein